jgi:uncharacterized protein (TIGR03437 family)
MMLCSVANLSGQALGRRLELDQVQYRAVAGERVRIRAPRDEFEFMRSARNRATRASGRSIRSFVLGPSTEEDAILIGVPLTAAPGDYAVELSFGNDAGEERTATIQLKVEPFAQPSPVSTTPPVVLLDGFQLPGLSGPCPMSSDSSGTFGNLRNYLIGAPSLAPIENIYFFENCTECPNCSIEQLGADLGAFLSALPVPQVDIVAHSMGGLIVRAYLAGKQAAGGFSPPLTPKIRKAVFIATPHFGSYQADSLLASILFAAGVQNNEMKRGSAFLWDLATWNQFGDDLRGVDAVAVIGNAGPSQQSDGVVISTSASLDFVSRGRTRVVGYCHVRFGALTASVVGCTQPGIAYVDKPSHPTYQIVSSFLAGTSAWQSVGIAPLQDSNLARYGGVVVGDLSSNGQYVTPSSVSWGSVPFAQGAAASLFFHDLVSGTGSFNFGASTCGPYSAVAGMYSAVRCKFAPTIYGVAPLLSGNGKVVQAGTTITIAGTGFGVQQCATCRVTASNPQSTTLQVSSWSDSVIRAVLPANFGIGVATVGVVTASGSDAINVMAGMTTAAPVISLSSSSLNFSYSQGGGYPPAQSVTVTNTGGGTLSYSVLANAPWLTTTVAAGGITISVNPVGLAANTYQASINVSAAGASNTPQTISVELVVTGPPLPLVSITGIRHSGTGLSGPIAPGELITIIGSGLGPSTPAVFSVNPVTGMVDASLAGTRVFFGSIAAPITYTSANQINVISPYEIASLSQVAIQVQYQGSISTVQTLQVVPASPGAYTLDSSGAGGVVAANQDGTINGKNNPAAKGSYVTIYFTGGGQTNPGGVTGGVTRAVLKWLLQPVSVTVGNEAAKVSFDGAAPTFVDGVNQLNIQVSSDTPSGAQPIVITIAGRSSPSSVTLAIQ